MGRGDYGDLSFFRKNPRIRGDLPASGRSVRWLSKATLKLRRLSARNKSPRYADVQAGDPALSNKSADRESTPKWQGPATILKIDETEAPEEFRTGRSRWFVRARKLGGAREAGSADWDPASGLDMGADVCPE